MSASDARTNRGSVDLDLAALDVDVRRTLRVKRLARGFVVELSGNSQRG
jgi:hypothetical protein